MPQSALVGGARRLQERQDDHVRLCGRVKEALVCIDITFFVKFQHASIVRLKAAENGEGEDA